MTRLCLLLLLLAGCRTVPVKPVAPPQPEPLNMPAVRVFLGHDHA